MAKRLSKALRGKRRWIGVIVSAEIKSKPDAIKSLEMLFTDSELGGIPRLTEYNQNQAEINLREKSNRPPFKWAGGKDRMFNKYNFSTYIINFFITL